MTPRDAEIIAASAQEDKTGAELALHRKSEKHWRWLINQPASEDSRLSPEGQEVMGILRAAFEENSE